MNAVANPRRQVPRKTPTLMKREGQTGVAGRAPYHDWDGRPVPTHRDHVWELAFLFDATSDGRPIKALSMCDEYTRDCIGDCVARSITADDVADVLDDAAAQRVRPKNIRCDNGPEFVAGAIRDSCHFSGTGAAFIEPGSPCQNAYVESFNARARDGLWSREIFDTVREARVLYQDWRHRYNHHHPHGALSWMTPAAFAAAELANGAVTPP